MTKRIGLDLPDDLHAWVKKHAKAHRRSLQQDILWLIEAYRDRLERLNRATNDQKGEQ